MNRLSVPLLFWPASLVIVTASLMGAAWWANQQVERGLVEGSASQAALAIGRLISPPLPELANGTSLTPEHIATLKRLVGSAPQGLPIIAIKVWSSDGRIIYSTNPALIGQDFPIKGELERALRGETVYDLSDLSDTENALERGRWQRLLEIYSPITQPGTQTVTAVIEFYQAVDDLERTARQAQTSNWLLFGGAAAGALLILAAFVRQDGRSISRERAVLTSQVAQLRVQLAQAETVLERQRRGVAGLINLHEHALRQLQTDFNAGPAQNLSYMLVEFEQAIATAKQQPMGATAGPRNAEHMRAIDHGLRLSYRELAELIKNLPSPAMEQMTLVEVMRHAVGAYQHRTGLAVDLECGPLPDQAPGFLKTTLYRLTQAALEVTRASAIEARQRGQIRYMDAVFRLEVGCPQAAADPVAAKSRLTEIRWRVESLGGRLIEASPNSPGAQVVIEIPWSGSGLGWS